MPVVDWRMLPEEVSLAEAKMIVRRRRVSLGLMFAAVWTLVGVTHLAVLPHLEQTYHNLGLEISLVNHNSSLILAAIMAAMAFGIAPLVIKNWESELEEMAKVSEVPGKIKTRILPGAEHEKYILLGFALVAIYLAGIVTAPISSPAGGK